jgi:hypothetical protein
MCLIEARRKCLYEGASSWLAMLGRHVIAQGASSLPRHLEHARTRRNRVHACTRQCLVVVHLDRLGVLAAPGVRAHLDLRACRDEAMPTPGP